MNELQEYKMEVAALCFDIGEEELLRAVRRDAAGKKVEWDMSAEQRKVLLVVSPPES